MFTLYKEVVNSSKSVGFTKCRIIPSMYWMIHVPCAKVLKLFSCLPQLSMGRFLNIFLEHLLFMIKFSDLNNFICNIENYSINISVEFL